MTPQSPAQQQLLWLLLIILNLLLPLLLLLPLHLQQTVLLETSADFHSNKLTNFGG
jgi:hypothetical protein